MKAVHKFLQLPWTSLITINSHLDRQTLCRSLEIILGLSSLKKLSVMLCVYCMLVRLGFWTRETSLSEINVPYVVCCLETVGHVLLRGFLNLNSVTGYAWSSLSFANCMLYYVSWRIPGKTGKNRNRPSVSLTNRLLFRIQQVENITKLSFVVNFQWGN